MAAKKKPTKHKKLTKTAGKKHASVKKSVQSKHAKKRPAPKKKPSKTKAAKKRAGTSKKRIRERSQNVGEVVYTPLGMGARSGGQSGSLQGLSNIEGADSESVDELIEEGNAFEAEVVQGVEDAPDADQGEVHTHEVPEDDVPGEYDEE